MTPLYSAWIASTLGAALFFVAGLLLSRGHVAEAAAMDAIIPPRPVAPSAEIPAQPAPPEADERNAAFASLRTQVNQLRNALRDARAREQDRGDAEHELSRVRGDREQMMQEARRDVALELEAARRRAAELQQVSDENALLRERAAAAGSLTEKVTALETELKGLRARSLSTAPPAPPLRPTRATIRPPGEEASTADQLSALLSRLRTRNMRTIALADDLGLPIVGLGEDLSSLAAFAGYVTDIGRKSRDFLPIGKLRRVTVEDENDGTVTACPMPGGETTSAVTLITLTVGPGPSPRQVSDLLRSAASLIK